MLALCMYVSDEPTAGRNWYGRCGSRYWVSEAAHWGEAGSGAQAAVYTTPRGVGAVWQQCQEHSPRREAGGKRKESVALGKRRGKYFVGTPPRA